MWIHEVWADTRRLHVVECWLPTKTTRRYGHFLCTKWRPRMRLKIRTIYGQLPVECIYSDQLWKQTNKTDSVLKPHDDCMRIIQLAFCCERKYATTLEKLKTNFSHNFMKPWMKNCFGCTLALSISTYVFSWRLSFDASFNFWVVLCRLSDKVEFCTRNWATWRKWQWHADQNEWSLIVTRPSPQSLHIHKNIDVKLFWETIDYLWF